MITALAAVWGLALPPVRWWGLALYPVTVPLAILASMVILMPTAFVFIGIVFWWTLKLTFLPAWGTIWFLAKARL